MPKWGPQGGPFWVPFWATFAHPKWAYLRGGGGVPTGRGPRQGVRTGIRGGCPWSSKGGIIVGRQSHFGGGSVSDAPVQPAGRPIQPASTFAARNLCMHLHILVQIKQRLASHHWVYCDISPGSLRIHLWIPFGEHLTGLTIVPHKNEIINQNIPFCISSRVWVCC